MHNVQEEFFARVDPTCLSVCIMIILQCYKYNVLIFNSYAFALCNLNFNVSRVFDRCNLKSVRPPRSPSIGMRSPALAANRPVQKYIYIYIIILQKYFRIPKDSHNTGGFKTERRWMSRSSTVKNGSLRPGGAAGPAQRHPDL